MKNKLVRALAVISSVFNFENASATTAYDFSFQYYNGEEFKLSNYKGNVILLVNTASQCGFTKQYAGLEKIYQKYKGKGFVVIAIPSNDFGMQEPGNDEEIQKFCKANFGVTFPVVRKEIVSGEHAHPFYKWARQELGFGTAPKWNFHKYLIDKKGKLVDYFHSTTSPESENLTKAIEKLL